MAVRTQVCVGYFQSVLTLSFVTVGSRLIAIHTQYARIIQVNMEYTVMRNGLTLAAVAALFISFNVQADVSVCPKVSDIKASAYKSPDANIPSPHNEGFQYSAPSSSGKTWHGEALATSDSFLESQYELRADGAQENVTNIVCTYSGTTITAGDGKVSKPYLKLTQDK